MTKIKESTEEMPQINEMAQVGKFDNKFVRINSTDHAPAHVSIIDGQILVAKGLIPEILPKKISELTIIEKGGAYQESTIIKFIKWLDEPQDKFKTVSNLQACLFCWDLLHPEE